MSNKAEIATTTRAEADLARDRDESRRAAMLRQLSLLPVVGTIGRWDVSTWDEGDAWAGEDIARLQSEIQAIVFPGLSDGDKRYQNKLCDVDHLVGHKIHGRDIFVTDDKAILRRGAALKSGPGIVVMKLDQCLSYIDDIEHRKNPRTFPTADIDPAYHAPALEGTVRFDYSNNNGSFSLGQGHFYFETNWSKASSWSIHAYNDPPSIGAIALAKGATRIEDIRDAACYDYSSRTRGPHVGQIVIWRNVNGIYAATRIVSIVDDSAGPAADELVLEYVIQADGGTDFSRSSNN